MKKFLYLLVINLFLFSKSFALIEIDITRGNLDPLPIAISPLNVDIKSENFNGIKIKELGADIQIKDFTRFNLGEGIEKDNKNFADEVAEQLSN